MLSGLYHRPWLRWAAVAALMVLLLVVGNRDETFYAAFTVGWQKVLGTLGLGSVVANWQRGVSGDVTRRFLPAVATYSVLYMGLCLLLLRLLLPNRQQWHLSLGLYASVLAAYVAIMVLGKLAGNAAWAYRLSRHLIDFIVSPVPVAALYVLFRAGFGMGPRPA